MRHLPGWGSVHPFASHFRAPHRRAQWLTIQPFTDIGVSFLLFSMLRHKCAALVSQVRAAALARLRFHANARAEVRWSR